MVSCFDVTKKKFEGPLAKPAILSALHQAVQSLRIGEAVAKAFVKPRLPDQGTTGFNDAGPGATLGEPLQLLNPK